MFNVSEVRKDFPSLAKNIQLSSCSQSAMHVDVENAIHQYMHSWKEKGMDWGGWMETCETARSQFAKMINASPDEIAIVSSVSHAVSSLAASLPITQRKKVFITDFDFPTVGHVWQSHQDKYTIDYMHANKHGIISIDDYEKILDNETFLVSTSHVSFYNGYKQDLKSISEIVHRKGARLFVDAYQSLGQVPIDVKAMDIDFLAAGLQKYALGIPGIAFLYIKKELAEEMTPKVTGWFGQANPFAFDIKNVAYAPGAKRFDSGTFPMINGYAAAAGLKVLNNYKIEDIENYLQHLSKATIEEADKQGLKVVSPRDINQKGSNTAIYVENAAEVEKAMAERGFIVSARNDVIRIAPHFYNTEEDVRLAVQGLAFIIK